MILPLPLDEFFQCTARPHSGQELSSHSVVSSSRTVRPCSSCEGRWIGHWKTTWSTVCSSAPRSHAAEGAIPHLCKQQRKSSTPVRRRLSRTTAVLGRVIPGGWGRCHPVRDESTESRSVIQQLRVPSVIRPERRTSVVVWREQMGVSI